MEGKSQNVREIHLHMNKKQNGYQNVNLTSFFNLWFGIAQFIDFV